MKASFAVAIAKANLDGRVTAPSLDVHIRHAPTGARNAVITFVELDDVELANVLAWNGTGILTPSRDDDTNAVAWSITPITFASSLRGE